MTVSSTDSSFSYDGTGSMVNFPTPYFIAKSHIVAIHSDVNGIENTWVENTDYTLTGVGNEGGGTLTAVTAPASGERLVVKRVVPNTQGSDYPAGGGFPSNTVEQDFDLAAMRTQQNAEAQSRTLLFKDTADLTGFDPSLPTPGAATPILTVNTAGTGLEWINDSPGSAVEAKASADAAAASAALTEIPDPAVADTFLFRNAANTAYLAQTVAQVLTLLGLDSVLKPDITANLSAGYTTDVAAHGTVSSGMHTVDLTLEFQHTLTIGGNITIAPPATGNGTCRYLVDLSGTGHVVTTSGFSKIIGSINTSVGTNMYILDIDKNGTFTTLFVTQVA